MRGSETHRIYRHTQCAISDCGQSNEQMTTHPLAVAAFQLSYLPPFFATVHANVWAYSNQHSAIQLTVCKVDVTFLSCTASHSGEVVTQSWSTQCSLFSQESATTWDMGAYFSRLMDFSEQTRIFQLHAVPWLVAHLSSKGQFSQILGSEKSRFVPKLNHASCKYKHVFVKFGYLVKNTSIAPKDEHVAFGGFCKRFWRLLVLVVLVSGRLKLLTLRVRSLQGSFCLN